MRVFDIIERLACRLVGLARSSFRRPLNRDTIDNPDRALRAWLRAYARKHARWGYRRAYVQASNDGWVVNHKKILRLWGEDGLRVVVKRRQKRTGVSDLPTITKAEAPGDVWVIDFQFHSTVAGKPLKILSIVDEQTREALGGQVGYSITASDLTDELDVLAIEHGSPRALRMDNGPEFISKALRGWAQEVDLVFIPPAQPWRNGFIESFNGRLRDECLGVDQFYSLSHAKGVIGIWKEE
jgi:putative transposase